MRRGGGFPQLYFVLMPVLEHWLKGAGCFISSSQVVRCTLENAVSVAKTFLLADVVVTEIPEKEPAAAAGGAQAGDYGGDY